MKVDSYHWSIQCPLHYEMLALLVDFSDYLAITVHDLEQEPALAVEQRMFFPFLTVVDGTTRFFAPIRRGFLERLLWGELPPEKPSSHGVFPNGTLDWFPAQGYRNEGLLSVEPGYCRLHLVSKRL